MSKQGTIVIVDAYYPTRRIAPRFIEAGFDCVRVQSTPEVPAVYSSSFSLDDYSDNIVHQGDFEATAAKVAAFDPVAVIPGGEMGVEMADALSERLGLVTNGTRYSDARRNKYVMIERLREVGLRATKQTMPQSEEELRAWHVAHGGRTVIKPLRSAAGDGVHFCDTPDESVAAYRALIGKRNIFSETNNGVVAQEYLVGTEYVVDTISCEGSHYVTDIWKMSCVAVNGILDMNDCDQLLPRHGDVQEALTSYAFKVLDALNIRYGAGHLEIKMTPDGPCLVEIGARIPGGDMPHYAELCIGESQLSWMVDAYTNPRRFHARSDNASYELKHHFALKSLISPYDGVLKSYPFIGELDKLESLHEVKMSVKVGDRLRRTVDDTGYPIIVLLKHPIEAVVLRDVGTLRYLDGHAFYELAE
jgi:biotin carboxylase